MDLSFLDISEDNKASFTYHLTSYDVDGNSTTRISAYENLVQEAAGLHATYRKLGIHDLMKEKRTWVIARSRMEVYHYGRWPSQLKVITWAQDSSGFNCPRHVDAETLDGKPLFSCETKWAIIDYTTGRPLHSKIISDALVTPPKEKQKESKLPSILEEDENCKTILFRYIPHIHYLDTDLNHHVNNLSFLNWCLDALPDSFRDDYKPSLVDLRWIKQTYRHDNLSVVVRAADKDELDRQYPRLCFDIFRNEESGATTKVFSALMEWKHRSEIC